MNHVLSFVRRNHSAALLMALGLSLVFGLAYFFEAFKLGIGPEFLLKACAKLFYAGVSVGLTLYVVRKLFPSIDRFCSRQVGKDALSEFANNFVQQPRDPRLWISVFVHGTVFLGVCLLLALAF